ncbi:major facilitator superfamily domain-containing protein [Terfezia claveryi]|nr:major facilitator superfamily domain-containing protein [Terfezia claveryi]
MSATHVYNNRLDPSPSATVSSSTTILSSASSASTSQHWERIVSILEKEFELSLVAIQREPKEESVTGEGNEDPASDTQETHNEVHFEVNWDGYDDPENPQNWALWIRACILMGVSFQTTIVVLYSTSFLSGGPGMMKDFGITSKTILALGMTVFMIGLAFGPLVLAPMSELYGRRPVYILTLGLAFILVLPACFANNYGTILAVRFIGAFMGSVSLANAPGTLGDIFGEDYRAFAFSCYFLAPMNGTVLGPVIGGVIYQSLGWKWINWVVFILLGVCFLIALATPETYAPTLLKHKAERLRKEMGDERYRSRFCPNKDYPPIKTGSKMFWKLIGTNVKRPIVMGVTEPVLIFWEIYVAIIYAILYLSFVGYPIIFSELRGWSPAFTGFAFGGMGLGACSAIAFDPLNRRVYNMHKVDPDTGKRPPEARIACLCVTAILSPVSMLWFAWTCYPTRIHWVWPILAGVPYGLSNALIFLHSNAYLVDSYGRCAAILPLFGGQMYTRLGPNWAGTLVGLIAVLIIPIPWTFYKWGKKIRLRSPMLRQMEEEARLDAEKMARREASKRQQADINVNASSGDKLRSRTMEEV